MLVQERFVDLEILLSYLNHVYDEIRHQLSSLETEVHNDGKRLKFVMKDGEVAPVFRVVIDLSVDPTVEIVRDDAFKDEFLLTIM